jgi:hypothetical protein
MKPNPLTLTLAGTLMLAATACSPVLEATRPAPTRLGQFTPGETRQQVVSTIGAPNSQNKDGDAHSCDNYHLYITGIDAGGRAGIATVEVISDVFTLGIAELAMTPMEIVTRDKQHGVNFCYDAEDKLLWVRDQGPV